MMEYETIAIILAISGQYIFLIKMYSEIQKISFEFSLCPHHRTVDQIAEARRKAAEAERSVFTRGLK